MGIGDAMTRRAVFLDRDGVINRVVVQNGRPYPPAGWAELEIIAGVPEALAQLKSAGYLLLVVTNQPDVGRGKTPAAVVEAIHNHLRSVLPLDGIYVCTHGGGADVCDCRKPRPGMLLAGRDDFGLDMASSFMVGDRWRDIDAGAAAGCRTIMIDYGYDEKAPDHTPDYVCGSLTEAAEKILTF